MVKFAMRLVFIMTVCFIGIGALSADQISAIENFIRVGLTCFDLHAATVSVVHEGKVVMSHAQGLADPGHVEKTVSNDTLFGIASLTKAFTSALLLKLLQRNNNITINTRVKDIFGADFRFFDSQQTEYSTLKDLLAHRVGVPNHNRLRLDTNLTRQNLPSRLKFVQATSKTSFRSSFYYNNLLYGVLARISEIIGGKSWETLMTEEILKPLGMNATRFRSIVDLQSIDLALPYMRTINGSLRAMSSDFIKLWGIIGGSGTLLSNSDDMAKWMLFHLNKGRNEAGQQIVDSDIMADMYESQNVARQTPNSDFTQPNVLATTSTDNYALGWRIGYYRGFPLFSHTGSSWGSLAFISIIPEKTIGVFSAVTGSDPGYKFRTLLHNYIWDMLLGETPWINASSVCNHFEEPSPLFDIIKNITAQRPLTDYVGFYHNDIYGWLEVDFRTGPEGLILSYGFGEWTLYPTPNSDEFVGEGADRVWQMTLFRVQFQIDTDIKKVTVPLLRNSVFITGPNTGEEHTTSPPVNTSLATRIHQRVGNGLTLILFTALFIVANEI